MSSESLKEALPESLFEGEGGSLVLRGFRRGVCGGAFFGGALSESPSDDESSMTLLLRHLPGVVGGFTTFSDCY
jgi:hypothetical protein